MRRSKTPYPPQIGEYIIRRKSGPALREYDTARLQISVGQPYHEGEKFAATVDWLRPRFKRVIVCVNDTLQQHNYRFNEHLPEQQAFEKSLKAGREWLDRNAMIISTLPHVSVHRWEDWKAHPGFAQTYEKTLRLYAENAEFRAAVDENIRAFWDRRADRRNLSDAYRFAEFREMGKAYLLEETAGFSLMFAQNRAVDIYPGSVLLPCVLFQGRKIPGAPEGLECGAFARIDFNRNKNLQPWGTSAQSGAMAATL